MKLSNDPIQIILDAEAKADAIIADAKVKAREIKLAAEKKASDDKEKALSDAKNEALITENSGAAFGESKANQIIKDAEKECEDLSFTAASNMEKAVKLITEKVVKAKCQ